MIPWVFGLLVKVGETHAIDQGLIPGSSWLRQKSGVGQEIANSEIFYCL